MEAKLATARGTDPSTQVENFSSAFCKTFSACRSIGANSQFTGIYNRAMSLRPEPIANFTTQEAIYESMPEVRPELC
jgi:hypothetical protein